MGLCRLDGASVLLLPCHLQTRARKIAKKKINNMDLPISIAITYVLHKIKLRDIMTFICVSFGSDIVHISSVWRAVFSEPLSTLKDKDKSVC